MSGHKIICYFCEDSLEEVIDFPKCFKCKKTFHAEHCNIKSLSNWKKLGKKRKSWKCAFCNCKMCVDKDSLIEQLQGDLSDALQEIEALKLEINNIKASSLDQKPKTQEVSYSPEITTSNRFSLLDPENNHNEEPQANPGNHSPEINEKPNPNQRQKSKRKRRVILAADSHGRDCALILQEQLGEDFEVFVHTQPGAPFNAVMEKGTHLAEKNTEEDFLVILAGTNNIDHTGRVPDLNIQKLEEVAVSSNVILSHVPARFDQYNLNHCISSLNAKLDRLAKRSSIETVSLKTTDRSLYTRHGLHFNKLGKVFVCKQFSDKIKNTISSKIIDFLGN